MSIYGYISKIDARILCIMVNVRNVDLYALVHAIKINPKSMIYNLLGAPIKPPQPDPPLSNPSQQIS